MAGLAAAEAGADSAAPARRADSPQTRSEVVTFQKVLRDRIKDGIVMGRDCGIRILGNRLSGQKIDAQFRPTRRLVLMVGGPTCKAIDDLFSKAEG